MLNNPTSININLIIEFSVQNTYHFEVRVGGLYWNVLHVSGKPLIEPDIVPPLHGHQVTKPLQEKLSLDKTTEEKQFILYAINCHTLTWWASSWPITIVTQSLSETEDVRGS